MMKYANARKLRTIESKYSDTRKWQQALGKALDKLSRVQSGELTIKGAIPLASQLTEQELQSVLESVTQTWEETINTIQIVMDRPF